MRSRPAPPDPAIPPDTTARTRIRDAAILRFAREGFRVGVRAIAQDAEVSPALVLHHFGSKDGLRMACDEHVMRLIGERKYAAAGTDGPSAMIAGLAAMDEMAPLLAYCLRSLQAGGDLARSFIDNFVVDAEAWIAAGVAAGTIRPSLDEKARARYLTVQSFGALTLELTLNPPDDPTDMVALMHAFADRTSLPSIELYTQGFLTDRTMLDAYLAYSGHAGGPAPEAADPPS